MFLCSNNSGWVSVFIQRSQSQTIQLSSHDRTQIGWVTLLFWSLNSSLFVGDFRSLSCCQLSDFVAIFNNFSDPPSDFFPKKRLATNLATSWTNFSESLWSLVLPQRLEISAHAALSLHLLCSVSVWEEQPVQLKQILCCFSNFTYKYSHGISHSTRNVFVYVLFSQMHNLHFTGLFSVCKC